MMVPRYQPRVPAHPTDDPLPWLTEMWGDDAKASLPVTSQEQVTAALSAAEKALNGFVAGLSDAEQPYRVILGKAEHAPAGTSYDEHTVFVGTKPWSHYADDTLTFGQLVAVFTGLAYHEVGHIRFDRDDNVDMRRWLDATYGGSDVVRKIAGSVNNVARDLRLEAEMQQQWPGYAEALHVAMWWVSNHFTEGVVKNPLSTDSVGERMRCFTTGARYPWEADWTGLESLRDYWADWAARSEDAEGIMDFESLTTEGVEKVLDGADPAGPPPKGKGKGKGEGDDESEDKPEGKPEGDEGDEREDGDPTKGDGKDSESDSESEDTEGDDSDGDDADDTEGEDGDDGDDDGPDTEGDGPTFDNDESADTEGDDDGSDDGDTEDGEADDGEPSDDTEGEDKGDEADAEYTDDETPVSRHEADDTDDGWGEDDVNIVQDTEPRGCISKPAADADDAARQTAVSNHRKAVKTNKSRTFTYSHAGRERSRTITRVRLDRHASEVYGIKDADLNYETTLTASKQYGHSSSKGFRLSKPDSAASQQLASVMSSARKGPGAPEFAQRTGRIDRRRLGRLSYGESRVFLRPDAAAPQKVLAGILIDASGSMQWGEGRVANIEKAAQVGRNLADAIEQLPWARGFVAAHTTAYGHGGITGPVYIPIWESGEPTRYLDDVLTIQHAGNEDGFAVANACEDILESLKRDEKGLLIVISDGAPAYGSGELHTRNVVDAYRKQGIRIVSVSISDDLSLKTQELMFGNGDVIAYTKNASAFAQNVARVIGSSI